MNNESLTAAVGALCTARALLITAGAGMGVDSGLPDFRGPEGFWRAYPPLRKLGLQFEQMANPVWFERDARLAWGFYGHRHALYSATSPHAGYDIMRGWIDGASDRFPGGYFVRLFGERIAHRLPATLIRINPDIPERACGSLEPACIPIASGARAALESLDARLPG